MVQPPPPGFPSLCSCSAEDDDIDDHIIFLTTPIDEILKHYSINWNELSGPSIALPDCITRDAARTTYTVRHAFPSTQKTKQRIFPWLRVGQESKVDAERRALAFAFEQKKRWCQETGEEVPGFASIPDNFGRGIGHRRTHRSKKQPLFEPFQKRSTHWYEYNWDNMPRPPLDKIEYIADDTEHDRSTWCDVAKHKRLLPGLFVLSVVALFGFFYAFVLTHYDNPLL